MIEVIKHKSQYPGLKIGDRLTFSIADSCGQCERCESGLEQKCTSLFKVRQLSIYILTNQIGLFGMILTIRLEYGDVNAIVYIARPRELKQREWFCLGKKLRINCVRLNCVHDTFVVLEASKYSKNLPSVTQC